MSDNMAAVFEKKVCSLKMGQVDILHRLGVIETCLRSYREAKPLLRELQPKLLAHFEEQKDSLYDQLKSIYKDDREKQKMIEFLIHDLKNIKINMLVFFDAHPADMGDIRPKNFIFDFQVFSSQLLARLKTEEDFLMPLLSKEQKDSSIPF